MGYLRNRIKAITYNRQKYEIKGLSNYNNGFGWITKTFFGRVK